MFVNTFSKNFEHVFVTNVCFFGTFMIILKKMMSGAKAPNYDTYGLFRATRLRSTPVVAKRVPLALSNPQSCPKFGYRVAYAPLLSSCWGGSQGLSPTYEQAHVGLDLLTLVSKD